MDDLTLALLGFMVCFSVSLIVLGLALDKKKREEVKYMIEAGKNYVRCSRCTKWTELSVSSMFKDLGVFCASCSKVVLLEPSFTAPIAAPVKKRNGFMSFVRGSQDDY